LLHLLQDLAQESIQILRSGAAAKLPETPIKVALLDPDAAINPVAGHTTSKPLGQRVPADRSVNCQFSQGQVLSLNHACRFRPGAKGATRDQSQPGSLISLSILAPWQQAQLTPFYMVEDSCLGGSDNFYSHFNTSEVISNKLELVL
jgi:hypothetical protein